MNDSRQNLTRSANSADHEPAGRRKDLDSRTLYFPKELSWLAFNERVLQEAADPSNPVIERVRFLGIFSNNQDEFFKVRVADLRRFTMQEEKRSGTKAARKLLNEIQDKVRSLSQDFDRVYAEVMTELKKRKIFFVAEQDLTVKQSQWLHEHFRHKILRHIVPILIEESTNLETNLEAEVSYLIVQIKKGDRVRNAVIDVPDRVPRFITVPPDRGTARNYFMLLDEVIRHCLDEIFGGFFEYDSLQAWSMKFSRDSEYRLGDDVEHSLLKKLSLSMKQRLKGEPMRLSFDRTMPPELVQMLCTKLGFEDLDSVIPGGRYRNFRDFIKFPNPATSSLEFPKMPALVSSRFARRRNVFDAIDEGDILLHYPYHRFSHFTEFVRQAAFDPAVNAIKINIYRAAPNSQVAESLFDAVRNGKHVSVNMELRARFDEQHNLDLTEKFIDAGIRVTFGIPNLKIHSKLCVVSRQVDGKEKLYSVISTGNFNEKTAKLYTDYALYTGHMGIGKEIRDVFTFIDYSYRQPKLKFLVVSPINTREHLERMIRREIEHVQDGRKGSIKAKLNNLVDDKLINDLYEASQAGVKIELLVRGMCSLRAGVSGQSENIRVTSIVGRFLEHSRVMVFQNNGNEEVYISSADWMTRNLDERVEVTVPIFDESLKKIIRETLDLQLRDNTKARLVDADQRNAYVPRSNRKRVNSQELIYQMRTEQEKNS
jgi:polyphosphate kinase